MKTDNLEMFCLTLEPSHTQFIKNLDYTPVGLGENFFPSGCLSDKTGDNISYKNKYYGEYTFHYWLWKNYLQNLNDEWIGFCQYRKFWVKDRETKNIKNFESLNQKLLKSIPEKYEKYDVILGEPIFINNFSFSKFIKHNFFNMISSPSLLLNKNKRNIKFHFDMWHGKGNLDKAINLLDTKEKIDFTNFVERNISFNPHNMFICKSKKILTQYYESVFPWLERCEKEFGFKDLETYGMKRIYGFLAERYMPYWFNKYAKTSTMPIYFQDISHFD